MNVHAGCHTVQKSRFTEQPPPLKSRANLPFATKRKGLQLALEPLDGSGIAGYVPKP
jgi:hypothetical protein